MLSINLLPKEDKDKFYQEVWRRFILFFAMSLAFIFIFGSALLLPTLLPVFFERREFTKYLVTQNDTYQRLKIGEELQQAEVIKNNLQVVKDFVSQDFKASPILDYLAGGSFPGIKILVVNVTKTGGISMAGTTEGRRELLDFEDTLRQSGKFNDVYSPLPNIVRGSNDFTVQAKVIPPFGL